MKKAPRVVLVTRATDYQLLLERHATRGQAEFFLSSRGQSIDSALEIHERFHAALTVVQRAIPTSWRSTRVDRGDLDRFVFETQDIVVALGQDGLVANLAKYLDGQFVIGLNPVADLFDGALVPHRPEDAGAILEATHRGVCDAQQRTMVEARLDDGQILRCLNEVFVGHTSHQSARYVIGIADQRERQSSSGLIVSTGTGATGWARSIHRAVCSEMELPQPESRTLAYFVREPWPSVATGCSIVEGVVSAAVPLTVTSEMDDRGVIFGDGIEHDFLSFGYGRRVTVLPSARTLNLVTG